MFCRHCCGEWLYDTAFYYLDNSWTLDYFADRLTTLSLSFSQAASLVEKTLKEHIDRLADKDQPVKYSGLVGLADLTPEMVENLSAMWPTIRDERRLEIAAKLTELSEENLELDFTEILHMFLRDQNAAVRELAVQGLWESNDRRSIRPLVDLLKKDTSAKVRAAAGLTLRRFGNLAQSGNLIARDVNRIRDALIFVIGRPGEDIEVCRRAIEAISSFDFPELDDIILDAYSSGDPILVQSAIFAMGQSSQAKWMPTVLAEIEGDNPAVRYEAAIAVGLLGEQSDVPDIIRLLDDEDYEVQTAAVRSLGIIGGNLAKQALLQCRQSDDEVIQDAAREALELLEFDEDPLGFKFPT